MRFWRPVAWNLPKVQANVNPDVSMSVKLLKEYDMKKIMTIITAIAVLGISGIVHAAQEQKPGQDRMQSAHDAAVKKCERLKGDAREACLKDAQAKKGAPAKADVQKPDRMQPEPAKPDTKK
jgi:hypothetical protein